MPNGAGVVPGFIKPTILLALLLALGLQMSLFGAYLENPPLNFNDLTNGSRGRARTYNITVNSRALYH